jgi:hypothetical protein
MENRTHLGSLGKAAGMEYDSNCYLHHTKRVFHFSSSQTIQNQYDDDNV